MDPKTYDGIGKQLDEIGFRASELKIRLRSTAPEGSGGAGQAVNDHRAGGGEEFWLDRGQDAALQSWNEHAGVLWRVLLGHSHVRARGRNAFTTAAST